MKKTLLFVTIFPTVILKAQQNDSIKITKNKEFTMDEFSIKNVLIKTSEKKERLKALIIPGTLITYGFISLESDALKKLDNNIKEEIWDERPHNITKIDNYLQYAPAAAVYTLNAIGIKGKNNFRDRTIIYLMSNAMMGITVQSLKAITKIQRPDGFGTNACRNNALFCPVH